jgi:hypothetical protein
MQGFVCVVCESGPVESVAFVGAWGWINDERGCASALSLAVRTPLTSGVWCLDMHSSRGASLIALHRGVYETSHHAPDDGRHLDCVSLRCQLHVWRLVC